MQKYDFFQRNQNFLKKNEVPHPFGVRNDKSFLFVETFKPRCVVHPKSCHSERSEESLRGFAPRSLRGAVARPESRGSGGPKDGLRR